jgi:hypothetical protein
VPLLFKEEDHVDVSSTTIGTKEIQWRKKVNKKKKKRETTCFTGDR